jgi:hypothetical protein
LPAGTYAIAAETKGDLYTWDAVGSMSGPGITFGQSRFTSSSTLVYPANTNADTFGYFGPNFKFVLA